MFENRKKNGINLSRYLASWRHNGFTVNWDQDSDLVKWLESLGFTIDDIVDLMDLDTCGKAELEAHARNFMKNKK